MPPGAAPRVVRFGAFELDLGSGELSKHGVRVKLRDKPFQILSVLVERPGEVITRRELQERLWPGDTFVEFENGLNNAISRLRESLGDNADRPLFIETLPRRGYRFVAPVEVRPGPSLPEAAMPPTALPGAVPHAPAVRRRWWLVAAAAVAAAASTGWYSLKPDPERPPSARSVAVLPFVPGDAREASSDEYVAFGMTEALITELSRVGALKVISQTSVMQYKGVRKALPEVARELGVGTIVEGSVLREGDRVRITVQLIDAQTDVHLWAQSYTRDSASALTDQRPLAREIAGVIRSRLAPSDTSVPPAFHQTNAAAYEAYVKGRYFLLQRYDEASWQRGREFFEESVAADPDFAAAYEGLASYYLTTDMLPTKAMPLAKSNAQRALALDDLSASAHASLAFASFFGDWDWAAVDREFARAVRLDPNDSRTLRWYALYLSAMGRHNEAIDEVERAIELDPVSVSAFDTAGAVWFNARRFDKILEQAARIAELSPQDPRSHYHFTVGHLHQGNTTEALASAERAVAATGRYPAALALLAAAQFRSGRMDDARTTMDEINRAAEAAYVPDFYIAMANLWTGNRDEALRGLQRGYDRRDGYLVHLKVTPWADALRDHPGFIELLRKMNFPG
jgi:TolB-like protein/DNA-binding winged helix-turn-helix (wHTH) protein/Tfp pilus assembly protein PilF